MKKLHILMLLGILGLVSLTGGCMAISAEDNCSCMKNREKFAELVAEKVVEKQRHEHNAHD